MASSPYDRVMSGDLWAGAVTTLSGVLLGGAVSFALARQQMKDARAQRAEEFAREKERRSADRRFDAYADFLTKARSFRNAIRHGDRAGPALAPAEIDAMNPIAAAAHSASSLVFLVVEDGRTYDACREVVRTMSHAQGLVSTMDPRSPGDLLAGLNHEMARVLREFEVAARDELEIGGLERSQIMSRSGGKPTP
jgi:hypothetical protein